MSKRKLEEERPLHNKAHLSKRIKQNEIYSKTTDPRSLNQPDATIHKDANSAKAESMQAKATRRLARKLAKRKRREGSLEVEGTKYRKIETKNLDQTSEQPSNIREAKVQSKRRRKDRPQNRATRDQTKTRDTAKTTESHSALPVWNVSEATGGPMLDLDPLFSLDEEYLLIGHESCVNVYSTTTSLLVRKLGVGHSDRLAAFAFSSTGLNHLYVATKSGIIQCWDWFEGRKIHSWFTKTQIYALAIPNAEAASTNLELVYTIDRKAVGPWRISAHPLEVNRERNDSESITLRKSQEPISSFKVVEHGRIIIASSGSVLTLGIVKNREQALNSDLSYTWRDIECPEWISCFDVRIVQPDSRTGNSKGGNGSQVARTDIVVGGLKGSLQIYDNLLGKLVRKEKRSDKVSVADLGARKLHWHRNAVLSAKWSRDGNYIISGGLETVLLIWQLETGNQNTLPHLGAPLDSIVVSPSGSSYAIRLADNSAMILSTAELSPTFSVAGIQLATDVNSDCQLPYLPNVDIPTKKLLSLSKVHFPIVGGPTCLLCAVPAATSARLPATLPQHASYLQSIDILSAQQVSRQALTRTKATDLNLGPDSNTIEEPDVILMQISHDGQWLATVDEWMPPSSDMALVTFDGDKARAEQERRKETYLKFWSRSDDSKVWELVSRIDGPHLSETGITTRTNKILDLHSNPTASSFATVGDDGIVRIWAAAVRQRHGLTVKDKQSQPLLGWHCQRTIAINSESSSQQAYTGAKLAYSPDGSCLVVGLSSSSPWTVHLIDPQHGTTRTGPYGPFEGLICGLGILDSNLIVLSNQLSVWNLVTQRFLYGFTLTPHYLKSSLQGSRAHMAVDMEGDTFAIDLPEVADSVTVKGQAEPSSEVMVFKSTDPVPIFVQKLPRPTAALITMYNRAGYHIINSAAEIQTVTPKQARLSPRTILPTPPRTPSHGLRNIYGNPSYDQDTRAEAAHKQVAAEVSSLSIEPRVGSDDIKVVSQEKLTEIFDVGPAYAMPPITDLFERVARLFAGKDAS